MSKQLPLKKGSYWISAKWRYSSGSGHFAYDLATNGTGHPIYSITDGKVVACKDGVYDNYTKQVPDGPYSGKPSNWIVIQFKNRNTGKQNYIFYQHLKRGIKVKKGQKIKVGQLLGYVGLTGNTSGPHLHLAVGNHAYYGDRYSYMNNNGGRATWTPMSVALNAPGTKTSEPKKLSANQLASIRPGKKNRYIKRYQQALRKALGATRAKKLNPSGATGRFGSETKAMTKWLQINKLGAKKGSKGADGIPGNKTFEILKLK